MSPRRERPPRPRLADETAATEAPSPLAWAPYSSESSPRPAGGPGESPVRHGFRAGSGDLALFVARQFIRRATGASRRTRRFIGRSDLLLAASRRADPDEMDSPFKLKGYHVHNAPWGAGGVLNEKNGAAPPAVRRRQSMRQLINERAIYRRTPLAAIGRLSPCLVTCAPTISILVLPVAAARPEDDPRHWLSVFEPIIAPDQLAVNGPQTTD